MSAVSDKEIHARLLKAIKEAGGVRAFARKTGYSPTYVSQVKLKRLWPGAPFLEKIGVYKTEYYEVFD